MTVRMFQSTDTGAPTVTGQAGGSNQGIVAMLDAILVNGYNSATVTITRSGSTATVSHTAHGYSSSASSPTSARRVKISGAAQSEYNGEFTITYVDANTYTYTVSGTPASPATGTITSVRAPLGWTTAFTGTNLRAYRPSQGNQFYLRLDDTGTAQARVVGYESMSDVNTGTNPFPTAAQMSGGLYWGKSTTTDGTARAWIAIGDEKRVYIIINANSGASFGGGIVMVFGDFRSFKNGDAYNCSIVGSTLADSTTNNFKAIATTNSYGSATGHYVTRSYTQAGASIAMAKGTMACGISTSGSAFSTLSALGGTFPDPISGGVNLFKISVVENSLSKWRGDYPGLWDTSQSLTHADTFSGSGALGGRTFAVWAMSGAKVVFETSDTWDT